MNKTANMKEYKRMYMKEWRKNNPDKANKTLSRYWEKRLLREKEENKQEVEDEKVR